MKIVQLPRALTKWLCGLVFAVVVTVPAVAAPAPPELHGVNLVCDGSGGWTETITDDGGTIGRFKDDTETKHSRSASGRVHVSFGPDASSIRFPVTMKSRNAGRWTFEKVDLEGDKILGTMRGLLRASRAMTINRKTGEIEINWSDITFSGMCQKAAEEPAVRKF